MHYTELCRIKRGTSMDKERIHNRISPIHVGIG